MKKLLSIILAICLLLTVMPLGVFNLTASAEYVEYTEGCYTYTVSNNEAEIVFYDDSMSGNVTIPATLGGYPVTSIGGFAFNSKGMTSVTIPDSVISIGWCAFERCQNLMSVMFGNGVTSIGEDAFASCSNLTSITIPDGVKNINTGAFRNCSRLNSIIIPDSVTNIEPVAFDDTAYYNNSENWKNNVLYVGNHLIKANDLIAGEYIIKTGTRTIAGDAFFPCEYLTSITIPDSVTSIAISAFEDNVTVKSDSLYVSEFCNKYKKKFENLYDLGDSNGDGKINVLDLIRTKRQALGFLTQTISADVNGDYTINALDLTKLKRQILGLE